MNSSNFYQTYYNQHGRGLEHIGKIYVSPHINQRGYGLGGFFQSLYQYVKPILQSGWQIIKKQGIKTAADLLNDFDSNESFSSALKKRSKDALHQVRKEVINKLQSGSGKIKRGLKRLRKTIKKKKKNINSKTSRKPTQSRSRCKKRNINPKQRILDIFG